MERRNALLTLSVLEGKATLLMSQWNDATRITKSLLRRKHKSNKLTKVTKAWRKEEVPTGFSLVMIWITPRKTEATKVSNYDEKVNMPGLDNTKRNEDPAFTSSL